MKAMRFAAVHKSYGAVQALRPLDLEVRPGEFLTLLGPSGSGKSTLLNLAAGHIAPDGGRILIGDDDITDLPPRRRNIGQVFQNYALFPHLTVFDNVAYGLRARGVTRADLRRRVAAMLALVRLEEYGARRVTQLSGGQQQRVALARSLVIEPDVLLLDEPMGALDRQLRKHLQTEIRQLHQRIQRTMIYVTHDQEEALALSDRIAVFRDGRIAQLGSARELYDQPVDAFVAAFLGESNLLYGRVEAGPPHAAVLRHAGSGALLGARPHPTLRPGDAALLLVRPEAIEFRAPDADHRAPPDSAGLAGTVGEIVYLGELQSLRIDLADGSSLCARVPGNTHRDLRPGTPVCVGWRAGHACLVPAATADHADHADRTDPAATERTS